MIHCRSVATASDRETFETLVARGSDALKAGRLDEAIGSFRSALDLEPTSARVEALLGLAHFRAGQLDHARPIYEDLCERLPTDASHRLNLGLVYLKMGDAERAITSLEASRALDPSQGRAVSYLGLAYARAGRYAEAYRSFLIANQGDLATEIEQNLTEAERAGIHQQLGRPRSSSQPVANVPASQSGPIPVASEAVPVAVARTRSEPRTKPPSAPPKPGQSGPIPVLRDPSQSDVGIGLRSMPAIVIDRPHLDDEPPPPLTESQQFVIGRGEVRPISDISQAVKAATPAPAALAPSTTTPLSQLATTDLLRTDDEDDGVTFELREDKSLLVRVSERVMMRLDGVCATGGDLTFEPTTRRSRGHQTDEAIDYGASPMSTVHGKGYLLALPGDGELVPVSLDDDILYLREDLVFAFEQTLRWETGHVPGLRGKLPIVQFRGDGSLVLRLKKPLVRVKLPAQGVVFVDVRRLGGWIGRVIPRAVVPAPHGPHGDLCIECTGEGIVLVEPTGAPALRPPPPPPPEPVAPVEDSATSPVGEPSEAEKSVAELLGDLGEDSPPPDDHERDQI